MLIESGYYLNEQKNMLGIRYPDGSWDIENTFSERLRNNLGMEEFLRFDSFLELDKVADKLTFLSPL